MYVPHMMKSATKGQVYHMYIYSSDTVNTSTPSTEAWSNHYTAYSRPMKLTDTQSSLLVGMPGHQPQTFNTPI